MGNKWLCSSGARPANYESGGEESVFPIILEGLAVTGFRASHVPRKLQSLETQSRSDAEEQSDFSSPVASETSYVDSSAEDDVVSRMLDGNSMVMASCSWLSSVASSAPQLFLITEILSSFFLMTLLGHLQNLCPLQ